MIVSTMKTPVSLPLSVFFPACTISEVLHIHLLLSLFHSTVFFLFSHTPFILSPLGGAVFIFGPTLISIHDTVVPLLLSVWFPT